MQPQDITQQAARAAAFPSSLLSTASTHLGPYQPSSQYYTPRPLPAQYSLLQSLLQYSQYYTPSLLQYSQYYTPRPLLSPWETWLQFTLIITLITKDQCCKFYTYDLSPSKFSLYTPLVNTLAMQVEQPLITYKCLSYIYRKAKMFQELLYINLVCVVQIN